MSCCPVSNPAFNPLVGCVFPPHIYWFFHPHPRYNLEDLHYFSSTVLIWKFFEMMQLYHAHCLNIPNCVFALIYQNVLLCFGPIFGFDQHCSSSDVIFDHLAFPWDLMFLSLWLDLKTLPPLRPLNAVWLVLGRGKCLSYACLRF